MHRICFIDDDAEFEIDLFKKVFGDVYDIIASTGYDDARRQIDERTGWKPDLFVLDLYFPKGKPDLETIETLIDKPLTLPNDRADIRTAYTNYVHAESRLHAILSAHKQGPEGGLKLAEVVGEHFPDTPIAFYSRKATFEDVVKCMGCEGVRWVEKKPAGQDDSDTEELTFQEKDRLVRHFDMVIADHTPTAKSGISVQLAAKVILEMIEKMLGGDSADGGQKDY